MSTRVHSITDADRSVLGPLAEHRILIVPQVALLLGVSDDAAARRLRRLHERGLVHYEQVFRRLPGSARILRPGLRAIGLTLRPPSQNDNEYRHDVGVGWLWLAARGGAFGELEHIATDRTMRAADRSADAQGRPVVYGLGLGLLGRNGRPQRHYPDLVLDVAGGRRVAVELELTQKSAWRMSRIMTSYASDARIDQVLYLVPSRRLAAAVGEAAKQAGIADIVHVQRLAPDGIAGASPRGVGRTHSRRPLARGAER